MKRTLWVTAATIALMAGMNAASAQTSGGTSGDQPRMQGSPSGSATPKGEEKIKPGVHEKEPGAAVQNNQKEKTVIGQGESGRSSTQEKMGQQGPTKEKTGQTGESKEKLGQQGPMKEKTGQTGESKEKLGQQGQTKEKTGQTESKEKMGQQGTPQQQGAQQGTSSSSAKSVQVTSEQRTKIQTTIKSQSVARVTNVNFDVRVGVRVPTSVRVYVLPIEIVEIVPAYRGYKYVLIGDEILILDPVTLEIVAIIPA